jgi:hypothetical protein
VSSESRLADRGRRWIRLARENTVGEAAVSAEEEVHEIMDSLENVRDLRADNG